MTASTAPSRNWAGNVTYRASARLAPTSLAELREIVLAHDRVKATGTQHSFNDSADTDGVQVSLSAMPRELWLDDETGVVSAPGGVTYAEVSAFVHERGRALRNLASLPHISLAGAVQTGTHGSGVGNPPLSGDVVAVHLVDAAGERAAGPARASRTSTPSWSASGRSASCTASRSARCRRSTSSSGSTRDLAGRRSCRASSR